MAKPQTKARADGDEARWRMTLAGIESELETIEAARRSARSMLVSLQREIGRRTAPTK